MLPCLKFPGRVWLQSPAHLNPDLIVREDVMEGRASLAFWSAGKAELLADSAGAVRSSHFYLTVYHSYQEIADLYDEQHEGKSLRKLPASPTIWKRSISSYKTPQEKNLALSEKSSRSVAVTPDANPKSISRTSAPPRHGPAIWGGLTGRMEIFSRSLVMAVIPSCSVFKVQSRREVERRRARTLHCVRTSLAKACWIWPSFFWLLFLALGFFHESTHGLTCKHYGGKFPAWA